MNVKQVLVKWQHATFQIDYIINFSKPPELHMQHKKKELRLLCDASMTIELKKSFFFSKNIDYLQHVITFGKLQVD